MRRPLQILPLALVLAACAGVPPHEPALPVAPVAFVQSFDAAEGITFSAAGELFVGANRAIWRLTPDGRTERLTDVGLHLGQAGYGADILAADFGATNIFRDKAAAQNDGIVWRVTRTGGKRVHARGIADPNFILVLPDRSCLVSDDGVDRIYRVTEAGAVSVWSDAIDYPNGMVLSLDHSKLYVAQIFSRLDPIVPDDRLWEIPLRDYRPAGPPRLVAHTGGRGIDGLALDRRGRVYVADNGGGRILRFDPADDSIAVVAEGVPHAASLVFGEGAFDRRALYVTTTQKGGGVIWKVPVGVEGAAVVR